MRSTCASVYPPSADAPHERTGWSGPVRCILSPDHLGDRHLNSGISWTGPTDLAASAPDHAADVAGTTDGGGRG